MGIARFQHAIESLQRIAVLGLQRFVANSLKQRLIILVDKDDYRHVCLLVSQFHHMQEAFFQVTVGERTAVLPFPLFQMAVQNLVQVFLRIVFLDVQVQMQNRIFLPLPVRSVGI